MRTLHLFAGAGGGLLADLILGHTPVAAVEWDAYCCQVLRERAEEGWFPGLRVHEGDVRLFDPSEYAGRVDCIAIGLPCQPYSFAGNRAGIDDPRGGEMWDSAFRCVRDIRPRFVFVENVRGFVSIGLPAILGDLASLGFDAEWTCLSAARVGAPHVRDRFWLLAYPAGERQPGPGQSGQDTISAAAGGKGETVDVVDGGWWSNEPSVGRLALGVPARLHQLTALGNAQVPLQAALAWRILTGG